MKIFALLLAIFALVSSAVAVKNAACEMERSVNGDGRAVCSGYFPSYTYRADTNDCEPFIYGGCGGNSNRFKTYEDCVNTCQQ